LDRGYSQRLVRIATKSGGQSLTEPAHTTIAALFEQAVLRYQNETAVTDSTTSLSYAALDLRAGAIGNCIVQHVSQPDDVVAILMERSCEMVAALIGAVKSGRSYVVIDPNYPAQRIEHMLQDTRCSCLLTTGALREKSPAEYSGTVLLVDGIESGGDCAAMLATQRVGPASLLYIIYTSGSTGSPKGVAVEHRSVANMALSYIARFDVNVNDRVLQFASMSFAASVIEVYVALLSGANLVVIPDDVKLNPIRFSQFVTRNRVSIALLPPNYAAELSPQDVPLRLLITAGSPTSWKIADKWVKHVQYCNVYGCSETATGVSAYVAGASPRKTKNVPIGEPNPNTDYYLLQPDGSPEGGPSEGELCIAGICLARGYVNHPSLDEQKFISTVDGQGARLRLYRTGDIARLGDDGEVEIVGRVDDQININGYRVEPGEINAHVAKHPLVEDCVVTAKEVRGKQAIVAYCVSREKDLFMPLRQYLLQSLPDYMLPHYVVSIDSIPLNINGKPDKSALPDPIEQWGGSQAKSPPQSDEEMMLVEIWADVLGLAPDDLSTNDNYFYLGGDSITAIKIVSRLYERGYVAELLDLMMAPTIQEFATRLRRESRTSVDEAIDLVEPVDDSMSAYLTEKIRARYEQLNLPLPADIKLLKRYPLSHMQNGLYLSYLKAKDSQYLVHNAFSIDGALDVIRFKECLEHLVARHEVLRSIVTHFNSEQAYQVVLNAMPVRLQYTDMSFIGSLSPKQEIEEWIAKDRERQFELECENAIRFHLLKWSEKSYNLVVCYHHIVMDGWCLDIVWSELQQYYHDGRNCYDGTHRDTHESVPASEKTELAEVQYSSYINWLANLDAQPAREYWQTYLQEYAPVAVCRAPEKDEQLSYRVDHFSIDAGMTEIVKSLARLYQVTVSSIMKTCWGLTLCGAKRTSDVAFGEVLAGRPPHLLGSESTVGLFVNTIPGRVKVLAGDTFATLVGRTHRCSIESQQYQYLPLTEIQSLSGCGHNLIDHIFVYENYPPLTSGSTASRGGFKVEPMLDIDEVNYHLNVSVSVDEHIRVRVLYRDPIFTPQQVGELFNRYAALIEQICENPEADLLKLLASDSPKLGLSILAGEQKERPTGSMSELLAKSAHQFSRLPAVEQMAGNSACAPAFGYRLSYAQLNESANQLARCLLGFGVSAGSTVALYLPRSTDYIVSILAVLKVGAVYLPLDRSNDRSRTKAILRCAEPDFVVCCESSLGGIEGLESDATYIDLHATLEAVRQCAKSDVCPPAKELGVAQLLFASGTTGVPKGVKVTHKGLVNHALYVSEALKLSPADGVLQFANLGFDAFSEELFPTLLSGARLVLRSDDLL
jgi:amino acid adenylation domain-containing protein